MPYEVIVDSTRNRVVFQHHIPQVVRSKLSAYQDRFPDRDYRILSSSSMSPQMVAAYNGADPEQIFCRENYRPGMKTPWLPA